MKINDKLSEMPVGEIRKKANAILYASLRKERSKEVKLRQARIQDGFLKLKEIIDNVDKI